MTEQLRRIELQGRTVSYTFFRKSVKNINLRIRPDGSVSVSANVRVPMADIERFLLSRAAWILRAIDACHARTVEMPKQMQYETGDILFVWGEAKTLEVRVGSRTRVQCQGDAVLLTVKDPFDVLQKQKAIADWKKELCREMLGEFCNRYYPFFAARGVAIPELRFRAMRSRWGSCQPQKGIVTFNTLLAEKPLACAEYVVVHELAHFLRPDHSPAFYQLVAEVMPDWKIRRKRLQRPEQEQKEEETNV